MVLASCGDRKHRERIEEELVRLESYVDTQIENGVWEADSVHITDNGLYIIHNKIGLSPDSIKLGDEIKYRYAVYDLDSTLRGGTYSNNLDAVSPRTATVGTSSGYIPDNIAGFIEGVTYMRNGGKATFLIPSTLAFGGNGISGISGYTTLRIEVNITSHEPSN